jgi:hypothetical protein
VAVPGTATVTVDVAVPADIAVNEAGSGVAVQPAGADAAKPTVPLNPLSEVTVVVKLREDPAGMLRGDGDAETAKSGVGGGGGGGDAPAAAEAFILPYPYVVSNPTEPKSTAVVCNTVLTSAGVRVAVSKINAAVPAAWGHAIDVPLIIAYVPPLYVEVMLTPGAVTSSCGPRLLKLAMMSLELVAPTAITEEYLAGYVTVLLRGPLLPAAATKTMPAL